jgi:radical SAM superfamily enzyme YgiQ (UPF0313 family)
MSRIFQNQLDCLFVFSPGGENAENYFFHSLGSGYIISFLRSNGHKAEQFVCNNPVNLEKCVKEIMNYRARVIGFTIFNSNFSTSVLIAERLKKASPESIIVFGGPCATNYSEFILAEYPFIDLCFRNESEETFLQFISQLSDNQFEIRKIEKTVIKGITYRDENRICKNPECDVLISNSKIANYLDKYPSPYLSGVIPAPAAFSIGLITARGCNQNCTYCNCSVLSKKRFFTHSIERIISEIEFISRSASSHEVLSIFDDAFSLIPLRAKLICKALIENKVKISLSCSTRCDYVDEELLELMKEAGFVSVGFSLESANPKTLRTIGKVKKAEDNPSDGLEKEIQFIEKLGEVVSYAKKIGIKHVFSSIMSGLPNETVEEANKTIETIDKFTGIDFYSHNFLNIYEGTPLSISFKNYGYKVEAIDNNPIFRTTICPGEIDRKVKISSKSHIHKSQAINDMRALKILSLHPVNNCGENWFDNIILLSDVVNRNFVEWLQELLSINGTIINIYSGRNAMAENWKRNYEELKRYSAPTHKILNYYIEKDESLTPLISYNSAFLNLQEKEDDIAICNFDFVRLNLGNSDVDFVKTLCKESDKTDAERAYEYLLTASRDKDLYNFLINSRPFPYFANLCKWTKDRANCQTRNTLIVNEKSEVKLCWYGKNIGMVGQPYKVLLDNFLLVSNKTSGQRKCSYCIVKDNCIKCGDPWPFTDEEYCNKRKADNLADTAGLFMSFDIFKQLM